MNAALYTKKVMNNDFVSQALDNDQGFGFAYTFLIGRQHIMLWE